MRRLRAGEEEAYHLLLERYGGRMLSVARGVLKDEEEALDARQDALLSMVRSLDGFAGEALLSTWLHRIVINASLMRLRSARRRGPTVSLEDIGGDESPLVQPRGRRTPLLWEGEALLQRVQVRGRVFRRLAELPEQYRIVVLLRDVRELSTREVAELLGISENAVKVRLHRARRAARALLEDEAKESHLLPWRRPGPDNVE